MKKICALFVSLVFVLCLTVSPVFAAAGGGKVQGENGIGDVMQGDAGSGESPGYDAQDNMVD